MPLMLAKIPPQGIDLQIQKHQQMMFSRLGYALNLADEDYICYGRAYKNQVKDQSGNVGYIPEAYHINGDYKEVLFDDKTKLQSFYSIGSESKLTGGYMVTPIDIIFHANLQTLFADKPAYTGLTHFVDAEARRITYEALIRLGYGVTIESETTGLDKVFADYTASRVKNGLYGRDMYPLHCWKVSGYIKWVTTVPYDYTWKKEFDAAL